MGSPLVRALCYAVLVALSLVACSDGFPPEFPLPEFSLKNPLTNTSVSDADLKGKPSVIYWFTSW